MSTQENTGNSKTIIKSKPHQNIVLSWVKEVVLIVVVENDLEKFNKLKGKTCNLCNNIFKVEESYEKITTRRKSKLTIHTDCIKKGF